MTPSTLTEMLENLSKGGITLAPEISIVDVIEAGGHPDQDYLELLCTLGSETEDERGIPLSHNVWCFNMECIDEQGDYAAIAQRLKLLAGDELPIEDIKDHITDNEVWILFTLDGQEYGWDLALSQGWADPMLITHFSNLLISRQAKTRFVYQGLNQWCLLSCMLPEQREYLNLLSEIRFKWCVPSET